MNNNTTKASAPETRAHSPLPWKIINGAIFDSAGRLVYASEEENGKIIVASVNQAAKLAEALRLAITSLDPISGGLPQAKRLGIAGQLKDALAEYEASRQ